MESKNSIQISNGLPSIILLLFGFVFFAVGTAASVWGVFSLKKAKSSEDWTQTEGKVTASEIDSHRSRGGGKKKKSRKTVYRAKIEYQYNVNGESFSSDRYSFGDFSSSDRSRASDIVSQFPKGKTIPVFYDPQVPGEAVLKTGGSFMTYLPLGVGSIFVLCGGGMLISGVFRLRKSAKG